MSLFGHQKLDIFLHFCYFSQSTWKQGSNLDSLWQLGLRFGYTNHPCFIFRSFFIIWVTCRQILASISVSLWPLKTWYFLKFLLFQSKHLKTWVKFGFIPAIGVEIWVKEVLYFDIFLHFCYFSHSLWKRGSNLGSPWQLGVEIWVLNSSKFQL